MTATIHQLYPKSEPEPEPEAQDSTDFGDGDGKDEIVIRIVLDGPDEDPQQLEPEEPKKSGGLGSFLLGAALGWLIGG